MEIDESLNAERQVGFWQSLPEISPENGDFASEQIENPNVELGTHTSNATSPDSEGAIIASITAHLPVSRVISFQDHHASGNNNPQPSKGQMPESVDLDKCGFQHSP
jgi:hypothetical protein